MTEISVIENRISSIRKYLKTLERYRNFSIDEILNDVDKKGAVERYLYLATQSAIDLADATISYKKFRKPTSMSESFHILNEEEVIPSDLTEKMIKMTGFRNVVAHDYEKIDYEVVSAILQEGLKDIENFTKIVSDYFKI
ncbi:MAG: DUF86 domain-containing protein [Parcubacteria group bacterium]|jgi:uncharacterized protein YutE (UPF0331/DUF86 family)